MARALLASMNGVIASMPKENAGQHFSSYKSYAIQYNQLTKAVFELVPDASALLLHYDIDKIPSSGNTLTFYQHGIFQDVHGNLSMLCAWINSELGNGHSSSNVHSLIDFFYSSLRPAMLSGNPSTEKEVQDTVERILVGRGMQKGIDYDRETGRVKFATKESVPDFVFLNLSTALEVKLIKDPKNLSRIVDEINADIVSYRKEYTHIVILVYDIGVISDVEQFKRDIESSDNTHVVVVKN